MNRTWGGPPSLLAATLDHEAPAPGGEDIYEIAERVHQRLIRDIDDAVLQDSDRERTRARIEQAARQITSELFPILAGDSKEDVVTRVVDEVIGLGPIEPLLRATLTSRIAGNSRLTI